MTTSDASDQPIVTLPDREFLSKLIGSGACKDKRKKKNLVLGAVVSVLTEDYETTCEIVEFGDRMIVHCKLFESRLIERTFQVLFAADVFTDERPLFEEVSVECGQEFFETRRNPRSE